jgi:diguanylate cyclase (GGDEF)-like protein/PAS domain S-box-containing protein
MTGMTEGDLRSTAETRAKALRLAQANESPILSPEESRKALFELEVHQIELEMQNEAMKTAQRELEMSRERYFELYDLAPVGYMTVSEKGLVLETNLTAAGLFGVVRSECTGRPFSQFVYRTHEKRYFAFHQSFLAGNGTQDLDLLMIRAQEAPFWAHLTAVRRLDGQGGAAGFRVAISDITDRVLAEDRHAQEKALLETTLGSIEEGVLSTDLSGNVVFANRSAEALIGMTQGEMMNRPIEAVFPIFDAGSRLKCSSGVREVLELGRSQEQNQFCRLYSVDGTGRLIERTASPVIHADGTVLGAVLVFHDYTEKFQRQEEVAFLNTHDPLTGLFNRRYFDQVMDRFTREPESSFVLAMADVNGLKLTNDAFGHLAGDHLLRRVAEILQRESRPDDVVARIGGDEFVLLLPDTDLKSAERLIKRMAQSMAEEKTNGLSLSLSIGLALRDASTPEVDRVFREAEDRMYRNKLAESTSLRSRTIEIVMNTLFEKSEQEMLHSRRVGELCSVMAEYMDFDGDGISQMRIAGLMHDIGKIGVNEKCLNKPEGLDETEWREMRRHPETGFHILSSVREFSEIARFVLEHHEHWDGTGYPRGISGDGISIQARIIHVVDAYDAMTTRRSYRDGVPPDEAIAEIVKGAGTQFDPRLARIFVEKVLRKPWNPPV